MNKNQFRICLIFSIILSLIVVTPYIIQINYSTNFSEFNPLIANADKLDFSKINPEKVIQNDLEKIAADFPNEVFLVAPNSDDYAFLARVYSGNEIKEFVSMQDYNLWEQNKTVLFEKEFHPIPEINERREIWIKGGISKKTNDSTDYKNINYAIGISEPVNLDGFKVIKIYDSLIVSKKE